MAAKLYTSESVTEGHPDKLCDSIADSILDAFLEKDKFSRVDCSALATQGLVVVSGEVSTRSYVDLHQRVRNVIREAGYDRAELGFDYRTVGVITLIREQGEELGKIVDRRLAGDQGIMVGYATDEARHLGLDLDLMPVPIALAHRLMARLALVRKEGTLPYLRPDGKGEVTVAYEAGVPRKVVSVAVAAQHEPGIEPKRLAEDIVDSVIAPVLSSPAGMDAPDEMLVNPAGAFVDGGPLTDTGESGRKIVTDSYGGMCRHGGSSLSGKDPTKIDRSGAYMARYLAKNAVAAGLAARCEVRLAYCIGRPEPLAVTVDTFGTGNVEEEKITGFLAEEFDLSPAGIVERLDLRRPIYSPTSCYGHFGRQELELPWERLDAVDMMRELSGGRRRR